jgi:hypothetical protein
MQWPRHWRQVGEAMFVAAVVLGFGPSWRVVYSSCHLCSARKEVETSSFLVWTLSHRERITDAGHAAPGHEHDWWRYGSSYSGGIGGCVGGGAQGKSSLYKDGSHAP